jgi:predicted transposase YdaD
MCSYTASVLERGLDQGRAEGRTEGRTEGLAEGRAESIERLLRKGKSPEEVHDLLDYPMEEILRVEREVLSAVK